jgi:predicted nucleic acid-binding protein
VVDASVGVKLYLPEELSDVAESLFDVQRKGSRKRFFVPDIFYPECANIFWKYVRRSQIPADHARKSLGNLQSLSLLSISNDDLLLNTLELALEYGITAYDASYAALAQELGLPFITADRKLVGKLKDSGTEILWLGHFVS